jgi:hypothetical protein
MFTGHTEITDYDTAPFETYLLIESDNGHNREAYGIDDDTPLDLGQLLRAAFPDVNVSICPQNGGENYAAIITDGRPPNSAVVWTSCDFYFDFEE